MISIFTNLKIFPWKITKKFKQIETFIKAKQKQIMLLFEIHRACLITFVLHLCNFYLSNNKLRQCMWSRTGY